MAQLRHRPAQALVCALVLATAWHASAQQQQGPSSNAQPPTKAIQPLYVCKMEVKDMPEYDGSPTPEMQDAQLGLNGALSGMLEQWNIDANGFPTNVLPHPSARNKPQPASPGDASGSDSSSGSSQPPAGQALPRPPLRSPAPAPSPSPSPRPNYIVPRPGTAAVSIAVAGDAQAADPAVSLGAGTAAAAAAAAAATVAQAGSVSAAAATAGQQHVNGMAAAAAPAAAADADAAPAAAAAAAAPAPAPAPAAGEQLPAAGDELPPNMSPNPRRRLFQQSPTRSVCNKGTPSARQSDTSPPGKSAFAQPLGTLGITMQQTNVVPPDPTIAVGPSHVLHVVNSLVKIIPVSSSGGIPSSSRPGTSRTIPLPAWFGLVASPCDGGYINPAAAYDKAVGRFLLTAICGGDSNQVLLAVSQNASALGTWVLYSFPGEVTAGTPMSCAGYPISFYSQLTYNQDGVYITFVQNCPDNQDSATGAILYALPKWAVYKGATVFWVPVWTAWDIWEATGGTMNDALYPGAFVQLQPVLPQRPSDVQAEVAYFVSDNLNYVNPLQRTQMTVAALINTGSLWLYEGPGSSSPAPLLVARVIGRDVRCLAVPTTLMVQPYDGDPAAHIPPYNCSNLEAGAMLPPGFWSGGAALYANKIYLADRGPDLLDQLDNFQPTIYWAVLTPSFCVSGPCAPWFGTDWGWDDGWDWRTGAWAADSDRGRNPYSDPAFYNQVFLFPSQAISNTGRRRLRAAGGGGGGNSTTDVPRDAMGVPLTASTVRADTLKGPVRSRAEMLAAVAAALDRMEALQPAAADANATPPPAGPGTAASRRYVFRPRRRTTPAAASGGGAAPAGAATNASASATARNGSSTVSASNLFWSGGGYTWNGWAGWGLADSRSYNSYYDWWKEYYFLRNLYMNLRIPPKVNPCKYYKDWREDNTITFGAVVSRKGVIEFASKPQANPVGLAFPQVAVRGGTMLVVYSFSGPYGAPDGQGGVLAYPGVGYSVIPGNQLNGGAAFNLAKPGAGCVEQGGSTAWGSYSGIDVHFPSYKVWSAVEFAATKTDFISASNAGIWLNVFA